MVYSSSLSDQEWEIIEPLLPKKKKTRPPTWTKRQILDGVFYQLKNGCNWADLPRDLPPYSTVYWHYKQWRESGLMRKIMTVLHEQVREQAEKKPKWTTLIIVDSQATKNTCNASTESKGFCSYKATNGIKRNLGVDSLGLPFFTLCTKASLSDDKALIEMFAQNIDYFKSKPVNIPKITVMVDHGYHPDKLIPALEEIYPQIMTKIRFKVAPKMSKQEKKALGISGFVVIPMRWIVERSNAWMERCKSLVKNFDRTLDNANTRIHLCFIRLMLKRLAKAS
jgi:transposase